MVWGAVRRFLGVAVLSHRGRTEGHDDNQHLSNKYPLNNPLPTVTYLLLVCPPLSYISLNLSFRHLMFLMSHFLLLSSPRLYITTVLISAFIPRTSVIFFSFFLLLLISFSHTFCSIFRFALFSFCLFISLLLTSVSSPMMIFSSFIMSSSHCPLFTRRYVIFHSLSFCRFPLLFSFLLSSPILHFFCFPIRPSICSPTFI